MISFISYQTIICLLFILKPTPIFPACYLYLCVVHILFNPNKIILYIFLNYEAIYKAISSIFQLTRLI